MSLADKSTPARTATFSRNERQGCISGGPATPDRSGRTYNLTDPANPEYAGRIEGLAGEVALGQGLLLSAGSLGAEAEALRVAAVDVMALVAVEPALLVTDDWARILHSGEFLLQVIPREFDVDTAEVELLEAGKPVATVSGWMTAGMGSAPFEPGLLLPPNPRVRLVVNRGTLFEKSSTPMPVQFTPLLFDVSPEITLRLEVDPINETVCLRSVDPISYGLGLPARVTISLMVKGEETVVFSAGQDPATADADLFRYSISELGLFPPTSEVHRFRVVAELPGDPTVRVERLGTLKVDAAPHIVLPVGHTFVKGVDLLDGHLVASSTDVRIPGRIPLEVTRTYSSAGISDEGVMGSGWTINYISTLIVTECNYVVVGGDGSGQRFVKEGSRFIALKGYHTTLIENPDGSFDFYTKGRIRYHYLDMPIFEGDRLYGGRPTLDFIEEPNGNRVQLFYDGERNITEVKEVFGEGSEGRSLTFEYEMVYGQKRIRAINGPLGLRVDYDYDAIGNLRTVTRDERVEQYEYSVGEFLDRHNLTAYTDPNGNRTEYTYYSDGDPFPGETDFPLSYGKFEWVKQVHEGVGGPEEATTSFVYDLTEIISAGRFLTHVTDPRGNTTIYRLNQNGSPLEIEEPGGILTVMEWAVDDIYKEKEIDGEGRVTRFEYDANANLVKEIIETDEYGEVLTEFDYDDRFNKMTYKKDAEGRETFFEINAVNGRLESVRDAEDNVTTYEYYPNGDLQRIMGPRPGEMTELTYDDFGNPFTTTDALGNVTTTVYDQRRRLRSQTDTLGRSLTQTPDELDRIQELRRTDSLGSSDEEVITRTFYPGGQVKTETNGLHLTTTFFLDGLNRVERTLDSLGLITETDYDGNGNLEEKTDRRGVKTINQYDALNRLEQVDLEGPFGPRQVVSRFDYDKMGNKRFEWDIHDHRIELIYDGLYRVTEKILPEAPYSEEFTYDRVGNKLTETDANGKTTTFEYDDLNRLVLRTDAEENQVAFDYDEAGNQTLEHDRSRGLKTETTYDFLNRPKTRVVSSEPDGFRYDTQFDYDDRAHTIVETDPRGFQTTTELDGFDRVHRLTQETGTEELVTTNFYDANGNLEKSIDAEGRTIEFVYDGLNRLKEVRHPLGFVSSFRYDGEGNQVEEVNRRNIKTTFGYDNVGRLLRTEVDASITDVTSVTTIVYDDAEVKRTETDARGFSTVFEMEGLERVVKITDPYDNSQSFVYDGVNKRKETDKRNHTTRFEYDGLNRLTKVTDPLEQELETNYFDSARQVVETDKRGIVKTTQLDASGRLLSVTRAGIKLEQYEYDSNNNRTLSIDANGNRTKFVYDAANRLVERIDGYKSEEETTTTFKYDRVGNLLEEKDGRVTRSDFDIRNTYDELNRLETVESGEGTVTRFEYDGEGNRTAQIEPENQRTEFDYGELNELIEVRMPDGGVFQYEYDEARNRIRQLDGEGHVVEFTYNKLNRLDLMTQDPDGFAYVTDHDYDPNGNEVKLTDTKGQVIDYTYDELNRMTAKVFHLTPADFELYTRTHRIDYQYDPNDNLIQVDELRSSGTDPPAVFTNLKTYDSLDRLISETDTFGGTLGYGYDPQGNRTSLTDPDGKVTSYTYDALNRLKTLTTEAGTTSYIYFPDGLKETISNPNGTVSTFDYDSADGLTYIQHQGPAGTISTYEYTYDGNGNRLSQIETNAGRTETTTYTYDSVNRLKTVTYQDGTASARTTTYTYNKAGNRLTEQEVEVASSNVLKDLVHDYDAINRLTAFTDKLDPAQSVAYGYDSNGNTTSKIKAGVSTAFLYDIRDQLGEVRQDGSVLGRYGFDYDGRRILKIGDEGRRHYTYDQLSVITEADQAGLTVSKYDYGLDQLVSLNNRTEGRSFFHLDFLDSTVNLTRNDGTIRESILYDAWGEERDKIGSSTNRFTFTGQETDQETGLYYFRARFYDPDIGRFPSQDNYLGEPTEIPSLHRYVYAHNRPTYFLDPSGNAVLESRTIENVQRSLEPIRQGLLRRPDLIEHPETRWVRSLPPEARQMIAEEMAITDTTLSVLETNGFSHLASITIEENDFKDGKLDLLGIFSQLTEKVGRFAWEQPGLWQAFRERLSGATVGEVVDVSDLYSQAWLYSTVRTEEAGELAAASGNLFTASVKRDATIAGLRKERFAPEGYGLEGLAGLGLTVQGDVALGQLGVFLTRFGLRRAGRWMAGVAAETSTEAALWQRLASLEMWRARSSTARFRGDPFAFGRGSRLERATALADEAATAAGLRSVYDVVDEIKYIQGSSYFNVVGGRRVLYVGTNAFGRTRSGQLMEIGHEIVHAQQWQRTVQSLGGDIKRAYDEFFLNKPFGSKGYAFDEMIAERLARVRVRRYLGGLSPQQAGTATRYINSWRPFAR